MKIQIWQQFSANHSTHFNVVGLFDTPYDAKEAAKYIRASLGKWAIQNIETDFADTNVSWLRSLEDAENAVYQFDRLLIIGSGRTWDPHAPIVELLRPYTLDVAYHRSQEHYLYITIQCVAPDIDIAKQLYNDINTFLCSQRLSPPPPIPPWRVDPNKFVSAEGRIEQENETLTMQLQFFEPNDALPAIFTYLSEHGCTAFNFDIMDGPDEIDTTDAL